VPTSRRFNPVPAKAPDLPRLGSRSNDLTGTADFEDLALVLRIRAAGPDARIAWDLLIDRYQDRIYSVCLRMVGNPEHAADLTQDCLVKVIQGLGGYDGRSKLSTWVIRVSMNTCLSWLRAQKLRRHASLDSLIHDRQEHTAKSAPGSGAHDEQNTTNETRAPSENHAPERSESKVRSNKGFGRREWQEQSRELEPEQGVQLDERRHLVAAALAALPTEQRAILVLRDIQGLDYEQIAEVLVLNVGTVKSRLFRARVALREAVEVMERGTSKKAAASDDKSQPNSEHPAV
jgi:RNA polymerase sigma-70 factor (ECF subfamily)